jgi:hypothetical protein
MEDSDNTSTKSKKIGLRQFIDDNMSKDYNAINVEHYDNTNSDNNNDNNNDNNIQHD